MEYFLVKFTDFFVFANFWKFDKCFAKNKDIAICLPHNFKLLKNKTYRVNSTKSFSTQREKREGEHGRKIYHGSPSKKKAVVNYVKVVQMNLYTLGAYFIKEDGCVD